MYINVVLNVFRITKLFEIIIKLFGSLPIQNVTTNKTTYITMTETIHCYNRFIQKDNINRCIHARIRIGEYQ